MSSDAAVDVSALAINVTIPEALRWADTRRGVAALVAEAATRAGALWAAHRGLR